MHRTDRTSTLLSVLGLPALLLLSCQGEQGIDRTVIVGQLQLTPAQVDEGGDSIASPNDELLVELPIITYRHVTVNGSARDFGNEGDADVDTYMFRTAGAGDLSFTFSYATGSEMYWPNHNGMTSAEDPQWRDTVNYKVEVIDPAWTDAETGDYMVLASFDDPAGFGGTIEFSWADVTVPTTGGGVSSPYADGVPAGTQLGIRVTAVKGDSTGDATYRIAINGLDPNDGEIKVGAYLSGDPMDRGSPVAGGTAYGWWWDDATLTWTGWYHMEGGVRRVVECEVGDQECMDSISGESASGGESARSAMPDGGTADGGTADGGTADGGTTDGGTTDGGTTDGGTTDGGTTDGGTTDGGTTDGGTTDGGTTDGGTTDGGAGDGGAGDGGTTDGGTTDGGTTDGGTTDGGTTDGGDDTGEPPDPSYTGNVNEGLDDVYIMAGTFSSLGGSIPGGTLFSTSMVYVPLDGQYVVVDEMVVIDDLSPKVYGWFTNEDVDGSLESPFVLPPATGPGFVDVITGSLLYAIDDPQGNNETDAFLLTVDEPLNGIFTASWPDAGANLDLYVLDADLNYIAAAYLNGDTNPEGFNASGDFGFILEPGEIYYVEMQSWLGTAGEKPYTIEIEWSAP